MKHIPEVSFHQVYAFRKVSKILFIPFPEIRMSKYLPMSDYYV